MIFSTNVKSIHWLKLIISTNVGFVVYFIGAFTKMLAVSNFKIVGVLPTPSFRFGYVDTFCTYSITPFNFTCIVLVLIVYSLVLLYSLDYMFFDPYLNSFVAKLTFFAVTFLFLLYTDELFFLLIAWEAVGLSSHLLISFYSLRNRALKASITALFYNKIGDLFLIVGVSSMLTAQTGSISLLNQLQVFEHNIYTNKIALFCFAVAGLSKSAQFISMCGYLKRWKGLHPSLVTTCCYNGNGRSLFTYKDTE